MIYLVVLWKCTIKYMLVNMFSSHLALIWSDLSQLYSFASNGFIKFIVCRSSVIFGKHKFRFGYVLNLSSLGRFPAMMHNYDFGIYKNNMKLIWNPAKQLRFWNWSSRFQFLYNRSDLSWTAKRWLLARPHMFLIVQNFG